MAGIRKKRAQSYKTEVNWASLETKKKKTNGPTMVIPLISPKAKQMLR